MAASLKSITGKTASIIVKTDDDDPNSPFVNVVYRVSAYSKDFEKAINEAGKKEQTDEVTAARVTVASFVRLVKSWDFRYEEEDTDPIPITEEALELVPTEFLAKIMKAIGDDQNPDPTT